MIYKAQGKYSEALKQYELKQEIDEQLGDLFSKSTSLNNIASIHFAQGNYPEAINYFEQALQILNDLGLADSPNARTIRGNIDFVKDKLK